MSSTSPSPNQFQVVIAGAGVAGLEAALALRELAGDRVSLTLLAPSTEFVYRPMAVREPFAYGAAMRFPLKEIARGLGASLLEDGFAWVDSAERVAHTQQGHQLAYDALILALGARAHPHYEHALTIDDRRMDAIFHGLIQDVEGQYVRRLVFVIPGRMGWPLPIYELALMPVGRAYDMDFEISLTVVTPEDAPLGIFGPGASAGVARLLQDCKIATIPSAYAEVPGSGRVVVNPGDRRLEIDRVVALPEL